MNNNTIQILGIKFSKEKVDYVFKYLMDNGGLLTVPAAPALVTIKEDKLYYESLLQSDIVIPDSGYMVLIWNIISAKKINKISGLEFINYFIKQHKHFAENDLYLINPSEIEGDYNLNYLNAQGFKLNNNNLYAAPFYNNNVQDKDLIEKLELIKPKTILINLGGGTQEKLGLYLKNNLSYKPSIICTGAAIAFKTGRQGNIPKWIDFLYLGWLHRCISNPKVFVPRYLKGFKLVKLMIKYKEKQVI